MILDKLLGFGIKNCDSGHCETESRGAEQQNRLLESSKKLKEQSSKHFLELKNKASQDQPHHDSCDGILMASLPFTAVHRKVDQSQ